MIQLSNHSDHEDYKKAQRDKILSVFKKEVEKSAFLIKAEEFEQKFPLDKFDIYTLPQVAKYRDDLSKAEGVDDPDGLFKATTSNLKHFVVEREVDGKTERAITFVREKEKGE